MLSDYIRTCDLSQGAKFASSKAELQGRYTQERGHLDLIGRTVPLFLTNGNHEGEYGRDTAKSADSIPVWATELRQQYFSNPRPDPAGFYTGQRTPDKLVGLRDSYYSFTWGNTFIVVLDNYWWMTEKTKTGWDHTLGKEQYDWLHTTLRASNSAIKLIFTHTLVGGVHTGQGRGGVEVAPYYEWGGLDADGSYKFDKMRPGERARGGVDVCAHRCMLNSLLERWTHRV